MGSPFSTGIPGLDGVLCGLRPGDNVVLQAGAIDDYAAFVDPFVSFARGQQRRIVYFRFARHAPLVRADTGAQIVTLDPQAGFETFLRGIHQVIEAAGKGVCYVFDSLSDLTADWYSDQMVGNFFELTCPFLYELETLAYFGLMRGLHSQFAMAPIMGTTQILLEVYRHEGKLYVHPVKVEGRSSSHMYMLHVLEGGEAFPVTHSGTVSEIMQSSPRSALGLSQHHVGVWTRAFIEAEALLEENGGKTGFSGGRRGVFERLLRMAISREERFFRLAERYFDLEDMVAMGRRLLGTGLIGGKSAGMLLARAILTKTDSRWERLLEVHDSFYVPSDVFYTFLVRNRCWAICKRPLNERDYLEGAEEGRQRILAGVFPDHIVKRFSDMLDYFGQSPIIVRSSSLLEDNFGNSFAGKYESVFCANQGAPGERLENLLEAVKMVYASTMSADALHYRARRGLLDRDEQMALLIQRVSGASHGHLYFPQIAGVAFSFNPYVWSEDIDPEAGVLRLVFGLGTRAVDRSDDDYTCLIALNAPTRRPQTSGGGVPLYSQRRVDVLDLRSNALKTLEFTEVLKETQNIPMRLFSARAPRLEGVDREGGAPVEPRHVVQFNELVAKTSFVGDMRAMLRIISEAYGCPVDVEFTANFEPEGRYKINLVQCRPLQVREASVLVSEPAGVSEKDLLMRTHGPVIGPSRITVVDRIIYVVGGEYARLPHNERYSIARLIGHIMRAGEGEKPETVMLVGPGRWGTSTPSLGVPVSFSEISGVSILCEVVAMRDDLIPDVSLGTHFFSELVEADILYMALFPGKAGNTLNSPLLESLPNRLGELLPAAAPYARLVKVIDSSHTQTGLFRFCADTLKQRTVCYIDTTSRVSVVTQ